MGEHEKHEKPEKRLRKGKTIRKVDTIEVGGADALLVLEDTIVKLSASFKLPSWNLARADSLADGLVRIILIRFDFIGLDAYFAVDRVSLDGTRRRARLHLRRRPNDSAVRSIVATRSLKSASVAAISALLSAEADGDSLRDWV